MHLVLFLRQLGICVFTNQARFVFTRSWHGMILFILWPWVTSAYKKDSSLHVLSETSKTTLAFIFPPYAVLFFVSVPIFTFWRGRGLFEMCQYWLTRANEGSKTSDLTYFQTKQCFIMSRIWRIYPSNTRPNVRELDLNSSRHQYIKFISSLTHEVMPIIQQQEHLGTFVAAARTPSSRVWIDFALLLRCSSVTHRVINRTLFTCHMSSLSLPSKETTADWNGSR